MSSYYEMISTRNERYGELNGMSAYALGIIEAIAESDLSPKEKLNKILEVLIAHDRILEE